MTKRCLWVNDCDDATQYDVSMYGYEYSYKYRRVQSKLFFQLVEKKIALLLTLCQSVEEVTHWYEPAGSMFLRTLQRPCCFFFGASTSSPTRRIRG